LKCSDLTTNSSSQVKKTMDDFQNVIYQSIMDKERREYPVPMIMKNLVYSNEYVIAEYNRFTDDLKDEEKSDRIWTMMLVMPAQSMISKQIRYRQTVMRLRAERQGQRPPDYKLFDGCHRFQVTKQFLDGNCYVKFENPNDNCYYYCWNTQEAVDREVAAAAEADKQYITLISDEFRDRLLNCPISMINLDPNMEDSDAYERARVANQCKPLTCSQIMKYMCSRGNEMAKLLTLMNESKDSLSAFLNDDLYRYSMSIIRMNVDHPFDESFSSKITMLQGQNAIERANKLMSNDATDDKEIAKKIMTAMNASREIINSIIESNQLRKSDHSQQSAIGLFYFTLTLAYAKAFADSTMSRDYISEEAVKNMFTQYINLDSSQKGDNHKRLFHYFTTGLFPDPPSKKRKHE